MESPATDVNYRADVETQIEILKANTNEDAKQTAAQKLWALSESKDRSLEIMRQSYIVKRGAGRHLLAMMKKGSEESQWCAGRVLVQLAFANEESSRAMVSPGKGPDLIAIATELIKSPDGCTDRVKETLFQLLNNVASNAWSCHEAIIQAKVVPHVLVALRSTTVSDNVKRAAVNFVYSLTFTTEGRTILMENDAVVCLVPIIKVNKATINSMCATLAISNLVGCRQRTPMLAGCAVPEKVVKAFEHALNRKAFGGQQNSLWKIVLAIMELSKSDANKEVLITEGCAILLSRLLDLPPERQNIKNLEYGCLSVWHLAFNGRGKALLCEQLQLLEKLKEISNGNDLKGSQPAKGALFQLGVTSRPAYADKMLHIFMSYEESMHLRASEIAKKLDELNYKVWMEHPAGKLEEQFTHGVADAAVVCACLSGQYSQSEKARTELTYASDCKKTILNLVVDEESRESSWLNAFINEKSIIDFTEPERDGDAIKQLTSLIGNRGKKVARQEDQNVQQSDKNAPKAISSIEVPRVASRNGSLSEAPSAQQAGPAQLGAVDPVDDNGLATLTQPFGQEGARAVQSAMDSLPAEERERLLGSRRVPIETIMEWSVDDVSGWLESKLQLKEYCDAFREAAVDGPLLVDLSDEELMTDLCVHNRLHRKKILTRIKQMLGR